jgi:hypothetical protein
MEKFIHPDIKWKIIYGIGSHREFVERFGRRLYLKPAVHEDIRAIFRVVQQLLIHSYFEYEFVDVAALKAEIALETALKLRYFELQGTLWPKADTYRQLLEWFRTHGYFETSDSQFLDYVREVRNLDAHPDRHSFGGMTSMRHIKIAIDLINDLYEDPEKRRERVRQYRSVNKHLHTMLEGGCILERSSTEKEIVYLMLLGFINNKSIPMGLTFFFKTIFDVPNQDKPSSSMEIYEAQDLYCHSVECGSGYLVGMDEGGAVIFTLLAISNPDDRSTWSEWKAGFDRYRSLQVLFDRANYNDIWGKTAWLRRQFHK